MKAKKIALFVAGLILLVACSAVAGTITHEYDELNRLIRTIHPDGTVIEYTYDESGNRLTVIKGNSVGEVPTVQISANPASIAYGASSTLTWSSTHATSCEIQPDIGGGLDPNGTVTVSPTTTTTYVITATGGGISVSNSVTVTVGPPPAPTVSISADPASIDYGSSSTLSWTSTNATYCGINGVGPVDPNGGTASVSPIVTSLYTITCTGPGGTAESSVAVTVVPPPPPTVQISANPASIGYGASSTLTWTSTNARSCTIDQGIGSVGTSGTREVSLTSTTTYTITATGLEGGAATATASVTVTVAPPPIPAVQISADPPTVMRGIAGGQSSTLSWSSTNATSCTINQGVGSVNTSGSTTVSPTATTTYTITATGPGGTATNNVTVTVVACDISLHDETIAAGSTIERATQCSIFAGPNYIIQANATVTLLAGQDITLNPGFEARQGCEFRAGYSAAPSPPPPTVSISANPVSIAYGATSTFTWTSTNTTSCTINQGIGNVGTSGTRNVSPTATTIYTITATGAGGTVTNNVTVTVAPPPPPTVQISANPVSIDYGASSVLSWSSTNAASCTIDHGIGSVNPPNGGTIPVSPTVTTIYTITATGPGGTVTSSVTVTVAPPPIPTVQISANPVSIGYGASSTLTWTSTNARSCTIDQGIGAVDPNGGTTPVSPTTTTTYTITATGPGGTATANVTVTVAPPPPPTVSISANPVSIAYGASSILTWSSTNAASCEIQPTVGAGNPLPPSGTATVSPTTTTTYVITATGPEGDTATASVAVTVNPPSSPTVTISANPTTIVSSQTSTLTWSSTNATSCTIDQGIGGVGTSGTRAVSPTATTTYTITATGAGDPATNSVTITVIACDISLHDATIAAGSTVEHSTVCTITAGPNYIIQANATVTFKAGQDIILKPGFEARAGCEFRAMKTP